MVTVADVVQVLERQFPPELAEDWDRVGLTVGSRVAAVSSILLSVDCTRAVVADAVELGAELVIAHHPPFLRGLTGVDLDTPKGAIAGALLTSGTNLYVAHTNADVPPGGVAAALAATLGLTDARPLAPAAGPALDKVVTFVPPEHAARMVDALAAAGAGAIGTYERCAFLSTGLGTFIARPGAQPFVGEVGTAAEITETRIEMVLARDHRSAVLAALLAAHPYETPAWDLLELADTPSPDTGLGRVGRLAEPVTLSVFADRVAEVLPSTAAGIRVAGDPDRLVETVALQAGAGDDLLDRARAVGADVYLTSDLRHHPAMEAIAWPVGPALIDVPHWAAEWTWLPVLRDLLVAALDLPVHVSARCTDPWTAHLGSAAERDVENGAGAPSQQ